MVKGVPADYMRFHFCNFLYLYLKIPEMKSCCSLLSLSLLFFHFVFPLVFELKYINFFCFTQLQTEPRFQQEYTQQTKCQYQYSYLIIAISLQHILGLIEYIHLIQKTNEDNDFDKINIQQKAYSVAVHLNWLGRHHYSPSLTLQMNSFMVAAKPAKLCASKIMSMNLSIYTTRKQKQRKTNQNG